MEILMLLHKIMFYTAVCFQCFGLFQHVTLCTGALTHNVWVSTYFWLCCVCQHEWESEGWEEKLNGCWGASVKIRRRFNSLMVRLLFITEEVSLCQSDTMATLGLCTLWLCEYRSPCALLGNSSIHKQHTDVNVNHVFSASCVSTHRSRSWTGWRNSSTNGTRIWRMTLSLQTP